MEIWNEILSTIVSNGIFAVLFVLGICLTAACIHFNESLSRARRSHEKITHTLNLFKNILAKRKYMFCVLQMAFAQAVLFGYIAASPFIIQQYYGFSPLAFSLFFAFNSLAIISGAGMSVKFKSQEKAILTGCAGMLLFSLLIGIALVLSYSCEEIKNYLYLIVQKGYTRNINKEFVKKFEVSKVSSDFDDLIKLIRKDS